MCMQAKMVSDALVIALWKRKPGKGLIGIWIEEVNTFRLVIVSCLTNMALTRAWAVKTIAGIMLLCPEKC